MVVLTVVTKDDVPQQSIPAFKHQEMYALALEQQLIIHYAFIRGDERLANTSTQPGMQQQEESRAIGYPIYMAFALDDSENDISDVIALDEDKSPETVVTKNKEQEDASRMVSHVTSQFGSKCFQSVQTNTSSNGRHVHFSNELTECSIDHVSSALPELESLSLKKTSENERACIDLTQHSTHEPIMIDLTKPSNVRPKGARSLTWSFKPDCERN